MIPAGMGGLILAFGIWLMTSWSINAAAVNVLSVLFVGLGGFIVLGIGALLLMGTLLARAARGAKRDAQSLAYSMKYMMNMGRMGGERRGNVVVDAEEIKVDDVTANDIKQIEEKKDDPS